MTSEKEKLEELLDSIKPEENRLTVNSHSKDKGLSSTKSEDEGRETGLHPSKEDPQPTKRMTGNPFDTDEIIQNGGERR